MNMIDRSQTALAQVIQKAPKERTIPQTWEEGRPLMMYLLNASRVNAQASFAMGDVIRAQRIFFLALCLIFSCLAFTVGRWGGGRKVSSPPQVSQPVKVSMTPSCPAGHCDATPTAPRPWPVSDGSIVVD